MKLFASLLDARTSGQSQYNTWLMRGGRSSHVASEAAIIMPAVSEHPCRKPKGNTQSSCMLLCLQGVPCDALQREMSHSTARLGPSRTIGAGSRKCKRLPRAKSSCGNRRRPCTTEPGRIQQWRSPSSEAHRNPQPLNQRLHTPLHKLLHSSALVDANLELQVCNLARHMYLTTYADRKRNRFALLSLEPLQGRILDPMSASSHTTHNKPATNMWATRRMSTSAQHARHQVARRVRTETMTATHTTPDARSCLITRRTNITTGSMDLGACGARKNSKHTKREPWQWMRSLRELRAYSAGSAD